MDEMDKPEIGGINLKLGDIIQIEALTNADLHQNTFIIDYIDETKIVIINVASIKKTILTMNDDGTLNDESVTAIMLMDRSEDEGYARQNGLLPHVWLDIYIGGDTPSIITGEISNLEEDMIEIITFPERMTIYIDFEYKGIPQHIPFQKFVIRSKPLAAPKEHLTAVVEELDQLDEEVPIGSSASIEINNSGDMVINVADDAIPDDDVRDVLHSMYIDANDLVFGEELEDIVQLVELPEYQRKYSIEIQANDLMDELLSAIPNSQRTERVLGTIHVLIERFKQLRKQFSKFDANANVIGYSQLGLNHKPLVERIRNLNMKLQWIIPVVSQKRKIYADIDEDAGEDHVDIIPTNLTTELSMQEELIKQYKQGSQHGNKYSDMFANMNKYNTPIVAANVESLASGEVLADLDAIVDNLGKFSSSVCKAEIKKDKKDKTDLSFIAKRRFVIQRYNLGLTKKDKHLMKSGKVVYVRDKMTPNDKITVKSILILPEPVMKFSQIDLPGTNIMTRTNLHQNYLSLFRLLKKKTTVSSHIVDDLDTEMKYDDKDDMDEVDDESEINFMTNIKEYILDDKFEHEPDKFDKFLRTIIPKTRTIFRMMRKYIKNKMSFVEIIKELEPFMVYTDDITFNQFKEVRYYIKNRIVDFNKSNAERSERLQNLSSVRSPSQLANQIEQVYLSEYESKDMFETGYNNLQGTPASELAFKILTSDNGRLFSDIITVMSLKTLVAPDDIMREFEPAKIDDETSVKSKDCTRRFLTKRYTTMKSLQADNNNSEVYYDKDLDDTPYHIMDAYAKEKKTMSPEIFMEFITETLVQKHNAPENYAKELAKVMVSGRKQVQDGEYAVLTIQPSVSSDVDETKLSEKEKKDIEIEAKARQKVGYYHRVKNHWVHDQTIDEEAFIDTNTLFCNIQKDCFKNQSNNICEPTKDTKTRMDELTKSRMVKEFENRVNMSLEQLMKKGQYTLDKDYKRLNRQNIMNEISRNRFSNYAYELGKTSITGDFISSPHMPLRDTVLGQSDFVKRQSDIIKFVEMFCREPMEELKDDDFWLYCRDTNTKLFPKSLHTLAIAFVTGSDYLRRLEEVCASHGTMSDDGDAVVDKHSGYVLRKIDFVAEDGYADGFKIVTNAVIEKDLDERLVEMLAPKAKPIFENESNEIIYNIVNSICVNMGIPTESIQEFVMRTTIELIEKNIQTPEKYEELAERMFKKKNERPIPYEIYKNRFMFWMIASCILVAIQTAVPSFRVKKTYPGCVRSFSGYPLDGGVEDITGIKYIACVMKKMESPTTPWNSIERLDVNAYVSKIKEAIEKFVVASRIDIMDLYAKKRKYMSEHPNEIVPEEHSVDKWRAFLPPVVKLKMGAVTGVSKEFEKDLYELMTKGGKDQHKYLNTLKSKCSQQGFAVIELINAIVKSKDPILKTASKDPFLENACCNDAQISRPMDYFIKDDPAIKQHLTIAKHLGELIKISKNLALPTTLYHQKFTGIIHNVVTETITEEQIYEAYIHYCNFNNDIPIPDEYLTVCPDKPAGFPIKASLSDQIEFLKRNGKRYSPADLHSLMTLVRNENRIQLPKSTLFSQLDVIYDLLDRFETKESIVIDAVFRDNLRAVMSSYDPKVMVVEERKELFKFKSYLVGANERMYYEIVKFFDQYGNLTDREYDKLQNFLLDITTTNLSDADALYNVTTFVRNSIYAMIRVFPEMILNGNIFGNIPKHWDLSDKHVSDMMQKINNFWGSIKEFHGDRVISEVLKKIQMDAVDIYTLIRELPVYSPMMKGENTYYSLFDNETINLLFVYLWYSMLYEYTVSANNPDMIRTDVEEKKSGRRQEIVEAGNMAEQLTGLDEGDESDLQEVEIQMGNMEDLKMRVAKLLLTFLDIEQGNKKSLLSYEEIAKKIRKEKNIEKQKIIEYLGNMDKDERQIEDQFKKYKMGRWNVGLQKGLVKYDKKTYNRETDENPVEMDAEQMEQLDAAEANQEEYDEAMDISQLGEDYQDGDYYGEDDDE
uniref:Uncharacterized protein n=1 Tax=viral metagenome TaxID=1070528 RepID=A0A6C0F2I7_9ZZZZ